MNSLIFSIATVVLTVTLLPARGFRQVFVHSRRGWFWLSLFAISSWLAIWAFWAGVKKMDPSLAAFLNRTEALIAVFMGIAFLKERFNRFETLGVVLSITGIVIMRLTLRVEYTEGFWLVLLGSIFFGITEFVSKIAVKYIHPIILAYLRNMLMAATYWIVVLAGKFSFSGLGEVWIGVLALGVVGPILSRMMYLLALKRMELSKVAVISQTQPVFVILIAFFALHQLPTFRELIGGVLIMSGCLLMIVSRQAHGWKLNRYWKANRV